MTGYFYRLRRVLFNGYLVLIAFIRTVLNVVVSNLDTNEITTLAIKLDSNGHPEYHAGNADND